MGQVPRGSRPFRLTSPISVAGKNTPRLLSSGIGRAAWCPTIQSVSGGGAALRIRSMFVDDVSLLGVYSNKADVITP
jgi:hypothetical protein